MLARYFESARKLVRCSSDMQRISAATCVKCLCMAALHCSAPRLQWKGIPTGEGHHVKKTSQGAEAASTPFEGSAGVEMQPLTLDADRGASMPARRLVWYVYTKNLKTVESMHVMQFLAVARSL